MTRQQLERAYLISAVGYGSIGADDQEAIRAVLHRLDASENQVNLLEGRAKLTQSLTIEPLTRERDTLRAEVERLTGERDIALGVRDRAREASNRDLEAKRAAEAQFREAVVQAEYRRQQVVAAQQQVQLIAEHRDTLCSALREAIEIARSCGCFHAAEHAGMACCRCAVLARLKPLIEDVSKKEN